MTNLEAVSQKDQSIEYRSLYLKVVEINFPNRRPRYPIKVKLVQEGVEGSIPIRRVFENGNNGEPLVWNTDRYLSPNFDLKVVVKKTRKWRKVKLRPRKEIASVTFEVEEMSRKEDIEKEGGNGLVTVKLAFGARSYNNASLTHHKAAEEIRKAADDAKKLLNEKPVALEKLGRARQPVGAVLKFLDMVSDIHPAAKVAVAAFNAIYKKLEEQEKIHDDVVALLADLNHFLPFTEAFDPEKMKSEIAKDAIQDFSNLFKGTCEFIVRYSSSGMIGDLISSEESTVSRLKESFKKVKDRYDWCAKTETWKTVLDLKQSDDERVLQLLQTSAAAPGKERQRTDKCCLPGTRQDLLKQIYEWAESDSAEPSIFWIHGLAGEGKSSISNTVACNLDNQRLLAGCFFCKRDDPDLRDPDKVIPSLAFHLSRWHRPYSDKLLDILKSGEKDKLASRTMDEQLDILIKGPILKLSSDEQVWPSRSLVIVIDALDEFSHSEQRFRLTQLLVQLVQLVPRFKLFATSRPLPELSEAFQKAGSTLKNLHLKQVGDPTVDIMRYTKHRAVLVAEKRRLEPSWLNEDQIAALTYSAHGLFIWMSTVFNFIERHLDVRHAVKLILNSSPDRKDNPEGALDSVYQLVLQQAGDDIKENVEFVKTVVGVISGTARNEPLSVEAIAEFIPQFESNVISEVVDRLQAVLYKDDERDSALRACHPSFIDFMGDEARSGPFWTHPSDIDLQLATRCLEIMKDGLSIDFCRDTSQGDDATIETPPPAMSYSCMYWMTHFRRADAGKRKALMTRIADFIVDKSVLYWLEILGIRGSIKRGIQAMAEATCNLTARDLRPVVWTFFDAIYGLPFRTLLFFSRRARHPHLFAVSLVPAHCLLLQRIAGTFGGESLRGQIRAITVSLDGARIACGYADGVVVVWCVKGQKIIGRPFEAHSGQVNSVVFSKNGKYLASGSDDTTICVWDVETQTSVGEPLKGHTDSVTFVGFSADSDTIVSGARDRSIRIWNVETCKQTGEVPRESNEQGDIIAVSPDGRRFASLASNSIRIWDMETGQSAGNRLRWNGKAILSAAFTLDGKNFSAGLEDGNIYVWDVDIEVIIRVLPLALSLDSYESSRMMRDFVYNDEDLDFGSDRIDEKEPSRTLLAQDVVDAKQFRILLLSIFSFVFSNWKPRRKIFL